MAEVLSCRAGLSKFLIKIQTTQLNAHQQQSSRKKRLTAWRLCIHCQSNNGFHFAGLANIAKKNEKIQVYAASLSDIEKALRPKT